MRKLLTAVFFLLSVALNVQAAPILAPNWGLGNVTDQNRAVTDSSNTNSLLAIVGGGSVNGGAVSNNTLIVDSQNISISNSTVIDQLVNLNRRLNPTYGAYVAGGVTFNNAATGNKLVLINLSGGSVVNTLLGRDAYGGAALLKTSSERFGTGAANNNSVFLSHTTLAYQNSPTDPSALIGGNVYGGYTEYSKGTANGNTVQITDGSLITANVYGGYVKHQLTDEDLGTAGVIDNYANNNYVLIKDSTVNGTVAGAYGAATSIGNVVEIDNSTVVSQARAVGPGTGVEDSDTATTSANDNTLIIRNGSTVANAAAVEARSVNATGNTLTIDDSTVNAGGALYAVNMNLATSATSGNSIAATVGSNTLNLNKINGTFGEIGATLNRAGTANGNTINITNSNLTLNIPTASSGAQAFFGDMQASLSQLETDKLFYMPSDKGAIFGGVGLTYTRMRSDAAVAETPEATEVAIGGTNSDNNLVALKGSIVNANIFGGISGYIDERSYIVEEHDTEDPTQLTKRVEVTKEGTTVTTKTTTWTKDSAGVWTPSEPTEETTDTDTVNTVYSASNNTVVLDSVNLTGQVYGGYVYGAELKSENMVTQNNTVVLRGNITLDPTAKIYGGSNVYYADTNKLVFDRVTATFDDKDQFQNFNNMWNINADFENTDIEFNFDGVYAQMTVDKSAMQENSKVVVSTQTDLDLRDIQQGEKIYDLTNSGIVLAQTKQGIYSYDLTGVKGSASTHTVDWVLTATRDHANAEMYGQLPLVGLALISEGPEMMNQTMNDVWKSDTEQNTFLNGGYHHTRYKTGSGFDLDSGLAQAGAWKKFTNDWMGGFFVKYAGGSYETFPIKVTGNANSFGGGLMTSMRYSETGRLELTAEAGYLDLDFKSEELSSSFKSKGMYYGASAGFVETPLEDLDVYANFTWKRKASDNITDDLDQKIKFDTLQSLALRFGADYAFNSWDLGGLTPSVGASAIYEMDGKSKVTVEDMSNSDASLKGMSGRGQVSLAYHNKDTFLPLHTVFTVFGQLGKREGFGGEVNISFEF